MRIYIAGPYCPKDCSLHDASRQALRNVDRAIEVFNQLAELGHDPFVPHLSHYLHTHYSCNITEKDFWYKYDDTFLEHWAEALYYISPSLGADHELALAEKLGLRIFRNLSEVPKEA